MQMTAAEKKFLYEKLPARICAWYAENRRMLPWRADKDPYKIWVSEIMLQQTRVEAVKPYFARFLQELPDIAALAACPEEKLLKLWEGLGYYSRVRNMQKAARMIEGEPPSLPRNPKELLSLPGIGSYTAGAIASIAYDMPVPAVDGNVLRILSRITADGRDVLLASVRREAELLLKEVLEGTDPGAFNQGMMDLGAGVCLPNTQPLCEKCPLSDLCEAHRLGQEMSLPVRKKAKERRVEQRTILVIRDGGRVALTRRPEKGLLAGMFEFPNLEGKQDKKAVLKIVEEHGLEPLHIKKLEAARHLFSHVEWQMEGYEIRVAGFPEKKQSSGEETSDFGKKDTRPGDWFLAEIARVERDYPVPSAYKAYARHLQMKN